MMRRVRVLFSFAGGSGHADPLVPLALALRARGHAVAFAGRASVAAQLARLHGFEILPDPPEHDVASTNAAAAAAIAPLLAPSREREERVLRDGFAGVVARRRLALVTACCAGWRPDLVVADEVDFGGAIAAELLGLPLVTVLVMAAGSFVRPELVAAPLDALRAGHGLAPDPQLRAGSRTLVLAPGAPSFRDPAFPLPPRARAIQPASAGPAAAPAWLAELPAGPTVYLTLGTVFNLESGDLFARALTGLAALPVNVVATVGSQLDPARFGRQPPHVRIERHVPQALLLPRCDAVVSHGGSGSIGGALAAGLPSVVLPMGADQPLNAARCVALGAGLALDPTTAGADEIAAATARVLEQPGYRTAAGRLRAEIAALPTAAQCVELLEQAGAARAAPRASPAR